MRLTKTRFTKVMIIALAFGLIAAISLARPTKVDAACANTPANANDSATVNVTVPTAGTYYVWTRMMAKDTTSNSYFVQVSNGVDPGCALNVGDNSAISSTAWTWVNYQDGSTTNRISVSGLAQGSHTIKLINREAGVKIDRVLLLSDPSCTPTNLGDNCVETTAPNPPTNVTATAISSTAINVSWSGATDNYSVTGYQVSRSTAGGSPTIIANNISATSFSDTGLTSGTAYSYTIKASDAAGNFSAASATASATTQSVDSLAPSVPGNLTQTKNAYNEIDLKWDASTDNTGGTGLGGYRLYRGGTTFTKIADLGPTVTTYQDKTVFENTTYSYYVVAFDKAANPNTSSSSNVLTLTTPNAPDVYPPPTPSGLTATNITVNGATLSWNAVTDNTGGVGLQGYYLKRMLNGVANATFTVPATQISFVDQTASPGSSYVYTVAAFDKVSNLSPYSTGVTVTTLALVDTIAPSVPTNFAGTPTSPTQVYLSWNASTDNSGGTGVAGYKIYRNGALLASTSGLTFSDSTGVPGQTFFYQISAYDRTNPANESAKSTQISVAFPKLPPDIYSPTVPGTPTATSPVLTAGASTYQSTISWGASIDNTGGSGLAGYAVYLNGSTSPSIQTASTSFLATGLIPGNTYNYTVKAYDKANPTNFSAASNVLTLTIPKPNTNTVYPPTNLNSSLGNFLSIGWWVNMTWTPPTTNISSVTGYKVEVKSGTTNLATTYLSGNTVNSVNLDINQFSPTFNSVPYTRTVNVYSLAGSNASAAAIKQVTVVCQQGFIVSSCSTKTLGV